jgi:GT2 family glycosyltransferase/glycosyltransferase involved in cell wall biosynthesis
MKILLVHHSWPTESTGGSEVYMAALARRLARDHDVSVLHRSADPARPEYSVAERREAGLRLFSLNNTLCESGGFEAYRDPRVTRAAEAVFDEVRPELVHVGHLAGLSTGLVFAARQRGAALVFTLHDFATLCPLGQLLTLDLEVCPGPTPRRCLGCVGGQVLGPRVGAPAKLRALPFLPGVLRRLARASGRGQERIAQRLEEMRETLRAADVLISPTRFLRDRFAALGVGGIEVLPYGHETIGPGVERAPADGRLRVGFVGAAIPSKGLHVLAQAWRQLADPRVELEIHGPFVPYHGDVGYEARVRALLGAHGAGALRGPFPHERIGEILSGLDVLVVPSIWEENAPLVVDEALQVGLPVVVSDHGGLAERVREGRDGLRFRPGDASDLARVLGRLRDDPALRAALGTARASVVSMDEHANALAGVYRRARERHATRPGRIGVVVLDRGRPHETLRAAQSAAAPGLAPLRLIVENGPGPEAPTAPGIEVMRLPENLGFAAGMNVGLRRLREGGCDRILLLNNDAVLEPGALRRLAEALEDPRLAGVGPTILRAGDGRVESRGLVFEPRWGRAALLDFGRRDTHREGRRDVPGLSGAVLMLSAAGLERVGALEESYFHSFEDADWSVRARRSGFQLAVVMGARAVHEGGRTLGPASADRYYYAARGHLRAVARLAPRGGVGATARAMLILARNLVSAATQREAPRGSALRAVIEGARDFRRGRTGPRGGPA